LLWDLLTSLNFHFNDIINIYRKYDDVTKKLKVIMDENERLISEQNDVSNFRLYCMERRSM